MIELQRRIELEATSFQLVWYTTLLIITNYCASTTFSFCSYLLMNTHIQSRNNLQIYHLVFIFNYIPYILGRYGTEPCTEDLHLLTGSANTASNTTNLTYHLERIAVPLVATQSS